MNTEANELIDSLIDTAIETLRRSRRAPQLTLDQWDNLFASVRETWMNWLPDYLSEFEDEVLRGDDDD